MRANTFAALSILSLATGSLARAGNRLTTSDKDDLVSQKSRVTAFVVTDSGVRVECWEIGDFLPESVTVQADGSKGTVGRMSMGADVSVDILTWSSGATIFPPHHHTDGVRSSSLVFGSQQNLFTVKDGLIMVEAAADAAAADDDESSHYIFADVNGDDWFYFEDSTTADADSTWASSQRQAGGAPFTVRSVSGSDTSVINFKYKSTPKNRVLHEGRCNFTGLTPAGASSQHDPDAGAGLRVQPSEL